VISLALGFLAMAAILMGRLPTTIERAMVVTLLDYAISIAIVVVIVVILVQMFGVPEFLSAPGMGKGGMSISAGTPTLSVFD
jgi:hypothetical protein